jgi:hypothetical protein
MHRDLEAKKRRQDGAAAAGTAGGAGDAGGAEPSSSSSRCRVDAWLEEGIVVKVVSKALKEHGYYKEKVGNRWGALRRGAVWFSPPRQVNPTQQTQPTTQSNPTNRINTTT